MPLIPRFQPIEILKPFLIIMISTIFTLNNQKHLYFKYLFSFFIIFPVILFLISQPDLGQTILIVLTWFSLIFVSGINLLFFLGFFVLTFSTLFYLILYVSKFDYIKNRLFSFIDPNSGNNYQSERASEAISNGGFFGQGIGRRNFKFKSTRSAYRLYYFSNLRRIWSHNCFGNNDNFSNIVLQYIKKNKQ